MNKSGCRPRIVLQTMLLVLFAGGVVLADETFEKLFTAGRYKEAVDYADGQMDPAARDAALWGKLGEAYDYIGMPEKSLASFLVAWRMNPENYHSLLGSARAYNKLSNPEMALDMSKKALSIHYTAEAGWEYAIACMALGRSSEAKKALEKVVEKDSSKVTAVKELSDIYYSEGSWWQAIPLLKHRYQKDATGMIAFMIGKSYTELELGDSAIAYLAKATAPGVKDSSTALSLLRARAYFAANRWGDCANAYGAIPASAMIVVDYYRYGVAVQKTKGIDAAYPLYDETVKKSDQSSFGRESLLAGEIVALVNITRKNFTDAADLLEKIVAADPEGRTVKRGYVLLAEAFRGTNEVEKSIVALEKAIAIDRRNIEAYARLADLYRANGMAEKAQKTFDVMLTSRPDDPGVYLALGNYHLENKRYGEAMKHFEKSNSLKKGALALQGIARTAYEQKDGGRAFSAASEALKLDSKLRDARFVKALVSFDHQKFDEAAQEFELLLKQEPENLELLAPLSQCYLKSQKSEALYKIDRRIADLEAGNVESRRRLAAYNLSKNKTLEALKCYRELAALVPESEEILKQAALLSKKNGSTDDAITFTKRYLVVQPGDAVMHRTLGDLLYENNDKNNALEEYRMVLRFDPSLGGFYKRYAELVATGGGQEEVIKALSAVVTSGDADIGTYMTLGLLYQNRKEYIEAIEMYQAVLVREPSNFEALTALASCQVANGENRDAIVSYEQAVMMKADFALGMKELGNLYYSEKRANEAQKMYINYLAIDSGDASIAERVAKHCFEKNDFSGAVRYFGLAAAVAVLEPEPAFQYAYSSMKTGKTDVARRTLLSLKMNHKIGGDLQRKVYRLLAETYESDSDFVAASNAYGDYCNLKGVYDADAAYKQGQFLAFSNPDGAKKIFEANIVKYSSDYRNYLGLALIYSSLGDMVAKALPLFAKVTELADSVPEVWLELGRMHARNGNEIEELNAYRKYLAFEPKSVEANRSIGSILIRRGDIREGVVFLETANNLQPNELEIVKPLAEAYSGMGNVDDALSLLKKAKDTKPDDPTIRFRLFEMYQKNGLKDKAQKEIEELATIDRQPQYMVFYAEALIIQKKLDEADEIAEELLSLDPENSATLLLKGKILRLQKRFDEAIEIYKEMNILDPTDAISLYERAETHLAQSKPQWAETFYKRALRTNPSLAIAELGLAKIGKIRNDTIMYREHLGNARRLEPDNEAVIEEIKKNWSY